MSKINLNNGITIEVLLGEKQFQFSSFENWCNKAQSWFGQRGLSDRQVICLDTKGRICSIGKDFMQARDEGAFPVTVYLKRG